MVKFLLLSLIFLNGITQVYGSPKPKIDAAPKANEAEKTPPAKPADKAPIAKSGCPADWRSFEKACYKVTKPAPNKGYTYKEAADECKKMDAALASVHSKSESNYVAGLAKEFNKPGKTFFWTGLRLRHNFKQLTGAQWADRTPVDYKLPVEFAAGYLAGYLASSADKLKTPAGEKKDMPCTMVYKFDFRTQKVVCGKSDQDYYQTKAGFICKKKAVVPPNPEEEVEGISAAAAANGTKPEEDWIKTPTGEEMKPLDDDRYVKVHKDKNGTIFVDIGEYLKKDGKKSEGKGISLTTEEFLELEEHIPEIKKKIQEQKDQK